MADVVVGFNHPGQWEADFGRSLAAMLLADKGKKILDICASESSSFLVAGRNAMVESFLRTQGKWLLMLDADMTFPPDLIQRLLRHATPTRIVGGLCFTATALPVMFGMDGERILTWTPGTLVPVLATGGACLMIHRSVFERIPAGNPYFAMDVSCHQMDQDQNFLRLTQLYGTTVAVDTSTSLGHIKRRIVTEADYQMPVVN